MTSSKYDTPSKPLIKSLGWKSIDKLINDELKIMMYKSLNDQTPIYLKDLFQKNSELNRYSLRNTETNVRIPRSNSSNGQKRFSYKGAIIWNGLSSDRKKSANLRSLKKDL